MTQYLISILTEGAIFGIMALGPDLARLQAFQAELAGAPLRLESSFVSLTETSDSEEGVIETSQKLTAQHEMNISVIRAENEMHQDTVVGKLEAVTRELHAAEKKLQDANDAVATQRDATTDGEHDQLRHSAFTPNDPPADRPTRKLPLRRAATKTETGNHQSAVNGAGSAVSPTSQPSTAAAHERPSAIAHTMRL